jgi:hypothetical protein
MSRLVKTQWGTCYTELNVRLEETGWTAPSFFVTHSQLLLCSNIKHHFLSYFFHPDVGTTHSPCPPRGAKITNRLHAMRCLIFPDVIRKRILGLQWKLGRTQSLDLATALTLAQTTVSMLRELTPSGDIWRFW